MQFDINKFPFGKKDNQSGDGNEPPFGKGKNVKISIPRFVYYLPILVILLVVLTSNIVIVKTNEYRIIRQFGEVVNILDKPGLHVKIPFIQTVTTLPKHLLFYDVVPAEINTLDKKRITVDHFAIWRISNPREMIESLRTVQGAEGRLGDIIYSNIRTELGKLNFEDIINQETSSRGDVNQAVQDVVNNILETNGNGIEVVSIEMKRADLPQENEQAVFRRMMSERQSKAQEYLSQGDAEANKITSEADKTVREMRAEAGERAKIIIAEGEQEAARTYNNAYGKDPEFYNFYRTLESYKVTLKGEPVIVLPISSPYVKLLMGN